MRSRPPLFHTRGGDHGDDRRGGRLDRDNQRRRVIVGGLNAVDLVETAVLGRVSRSVGARDPAPAPKARPGPGPIATVPGRATRAAGRGPRTPHARCAPGPFANRAWLQGGGGGAHHGAGGGGVMPRRDTAARATGASTPPYETFVAPSPAARPPRPPRCRRPAGSDRRPRATPPGVPRSPALVLAATALLGDACAPTRPSDGAGDRGGSRWGGPSPRHDAQFAMTNESQSCASLTTSTRWRAVMPPSTLTPHLTGPSSWASC